MTVGSIISIAVATAVSSTIGYLATSLLWPSRLPKRLILAFGPGFGAGLCSIVFFLFRRPMFTVELLVLGGLAAYAYFRGSREDRESLLPNGPAPNPGSAVLYGALGAAVTGMLMIVYSMPHGKWDGWAIWNTHARFLFRDGQGWTEHLRFTFHGDYPLLLPALTARFWRYIGHEEPEAAALMGIIFTLSSIAVLTLTLRELRGWRVAIVLGFVLLTTPSYLDYGAAQYADVPLSFFLLTSIALLCLYSEEMSSGRGLLILSGLSAGYAGWTKNEGLLFIVAASAALLAPITRAPAVTLRRFRSFAQGLLLPVFVIALFKITAAAPNDLVLHQQDTVAKLLNVDRHAVILSNVVSVAWRFGFWAAPPFIPLLVFLIFRGVDEKVGSEFGWRTGVATLTLILCGYYVVYLVTPMGLQLHLDSSLDRLLIHVWPSFLLLTGLMAQRDKVRVRG